MSMAKPAAATPGRIGETLGAFPCLWAARKREEATAKTEVNVSA